MSCLYCGKHVSLVRARFDADFCTKEHRNQHSARTRRGFDRLAQAQQETSAARHLNETLPLPARQADHRDNLDRLVSKQPGPALLLPSKPGILPRSRARLETAVSVLDRCFFKVMQLAGTVPQPVSEPARWNTDRPATWSRPPHPLLHIGALPECGSVFEPLDPAGLHRQPSTNPSPAAEFGAGSPVVPRFRTHFAASMPVALMRSEPAPDPITLPSAVASVTKLPPPTMSIHLGRPRPSRMEIGNVPAALPVRAETLALAPDGFRKRRFYRWEDHKLFSRIPYDTIAKHLCTIAITEALDSARHADITAGAVLAGRDVCKVASVLIFPRHVAKPGPRPPLARLPWEHRCAPGLLPLEPPPSAGHSACDPCCESGVGISPCCQLPPVIGFCRHCQIVTAGAVALPAGGVMDSVRRPVSCEVPLSIALVLDAGSPGLVHAWDPAAWLDADKPLAPIHEDFAAGLANWACSKEDWKQDIAGVRTGSLALLRASLNMRDYDLEFFGRMEAQSIGWVVRAADTSHYHALRILTGGSSGTAELIRYAVLADERDEPIKMPLSVPLSRSSGCRIKMSIRGNEFTLFLNNEPAAQWTDDRLAEGGVGFFADGNDRARLYWVKVTPLKQAPAGEQATLRGPVRQRRNREHRIMGV